jgi:hypothetical protein
VIVFCVLWFVCVLVCVCVCKKRVVLKLLFVVHKPSQQCLSTRVGKPYDYTSLPQVFVKVFKKSPARLEIYVT